MGYYSDEQKAVQQVNIRNVRDIKRCNKESLLSILHDALWQVMDTFDQCRRQEGGGATEAVCPGPPVEGGLQTVSDLFKCSSYHIPF